MRTSLSVLTICLLLCSSSTLLASSSDFPKAELAFGYSHAFGIFDSNMNGWNLSAVGYLNSHVGLVVDVSGQYGGGSYATFGGGTSRAQVNIHTLAFGPRLKLQRGRLAPYVQLLIGADWYSRTSSFAAPPSEIRHSNSEFAVSPGIGLDIKARERLTIRAIQLDGICSRWGGTVRVSAGVVFHLGARKKI